MGNCIISGRRKIYVASSWRNTTQPEVVNLLRDLGHEVYDFRNPEEGDNGFHWSEIDEGWENWTNEQYIQALRHPIALSGYLKDYKAMEWADTFVLVQPCGRSAHLELGWAAGRGKTTVMLLGPEIEPELMSNMCDFILPAEELADLFQKYHKKEPETETELERLRREVKELRERLRQESSSFYDRGII